jgi:hypothetical protein
MKGNTFPGSAELHSQKKAGNSKNFPLPIKNIGR